MKTTSGTTAFTWLVVVGLVIAVIFGAGISIGLSQTKTPIPKPNPQPRYPKVLVEEASCEVIRKWKHDEGRVVFVIRCPSSEDIGVVDVDEELYKKGGVMPMQVDKE